MHLWLGIRAYCGKLLTDGFVPDDMIDEIRGPKDAKRRAAALRALKSSGLIDDAPGGLQMHDYLQWSKSRDQVLASRKLARDRQAKSRGCHGVTDGVTHAVTTNAVTKRGEWSGDGVVSASPNQEATVTAREPDDDKSTICPLDLSQRLEKAGVYAELAKTLGVPEADLVAEAGEYVAYWTIGAGMGKQRQRWAARLRQRLVERARSGELTKAGAGVANGDDTGGYGRSEDWA